MAQASIIQNQFTRGELSPRMKGRIDLEPYYQGAETLLNFLPLPHGGATARPGTAYLATVADSANSGRLLPFIFNVTDTYILEFGAATLRFFRGQQEAQIVASDVTAAITNGTFDSGITGWTDQSSGGSAQIAYNSTDDRLTLDGDGVGQAIAEQQVAITETTTNHVLRFQIVGAAQSDTVEVRIGTTSGAEDILTGDDYKTGWHCVEFDPDSNASVYIQFRGGAAENKDHDIDNISIIDDDAIEITTPYTSADLMEIKYVQDADTMWLAHPDYKPMELTRSGHASWSLTYYTPTNDPFTSTNNYPAAVGLFEQRIVFGYTATYPQRLFFSKSADIQDMTTGTGDADAFTKDIYATQANPIRWIIGGVDLIVGTNGGEWVVERPASGPVTVSNFTIRRRETSGVANRQPVEVDNRILFIQRCGCGSQPGRHLREFRYDDTEAEYIAPDLTLLSEHISGTGFVDAAWQSQAADGTYEGYDVPGVNRVLWIVRSDGVIATFTYNAKESVLAWARQITAGASGDHAFESVAVVPSIGGDKCWVLVKRTINGATARYVEIFDPDLFLDAAVTGAGSSSTTWTGLSHLEGETVSVLIDGSPDGTYTVSSGQITGTTAGDAAQIGLAYEPKIQLMPLEMPLRDGTSIGAPKSVSRVVLLFLNTVGAKVTASERTAGVEIPFRKVSDDVAEPVPPFTGVKELPPPTSWADAAIVITQPNPLPCVVQAIVMELEAHR